MMHGPMLLFAIAVALLVDHVGGEPPLHWHPLVAFGRYLQWAGAWVQRGARYGATFSVPRHGPGDYASAAQAHVFALCQAPQNAACWHLFSPNFGLPGHVRLSVQSPSAQAALRRALIKI